MFTFNRHPDATNKWSYSMIIRQPVSVHFVINFVAPKREIGKIVFTAVKMIISFCFLNSLQIFAAFNTFVAIVWITIAHVPLVIRTILFSLVLFPAIIASVHCYSVYGFHAFSCSKRFNNSSNKALSAAS